MYDLIIIGAGPAGSAAAVYAGRKKLKTLLLTTSFGGQSIVSDDIQNWIGSKSLNGLVLAKNLEEHVRAHSAVEIKLGESVKNISSKNGGFLIETKKEESYEAKSVIVTSGSHHRTLNIPGEEKFSGKGVMYCSTCDAPVFKDKIVAVIGGGNAGLEAVIDLFPYASKIYLMARRDVLRGDPITQEKIKESSKTEIIYNADSKEVIGEKFVKGLKYKDLNSGEEKELFLDGVFVEIGAAPNSDIVKGLVDINEKGEIVIDHRTAATSMPGVFSAGDVTDVKYKQNNISAGDGVKAALSAYEYINNLESQN